MGNFSKKTLKSSPQKINMSLSTIFEAVVLLGTGDIVFADISKVGAMDKSIW